jgi:hypothetical protein
MHAWHHVWIMHVVRDHHIHVRCFLLQTKSSYASELSSSVLASVLGVRSMCKVFQLDQSHVDDMLASVGARSMRKFQHE